MACSFSSLFNLKINWLWFIDHICTFRNMSICCLLIKFSMTIWTWDKRHIRLLFRHWYIFDILTKIFCFFHLLHILYIIYKVLMVIFPITIFVLRLNLLDFLLIFSFFLFIFIFSKLNINIVTFSISPVTGLTFLIFYCFFGFLHIYSCFLILFSLKLRPHFEQAIKT